MVWIAGQTVGAGGPGNITFSSIPQTFTHLQIRIFGRGSTSFSQGLSAYVQVNGDGTAANYAVHGLFGNGSSAFSSAVTGAGTFSLQQALADSSAPANVFGVAIFDLLDYTSTTKNKVVRMIGGHDRNDSGRASMGSSVWLSTAAVTQLTVATDGAFTTGTRVDLYGITTSPVTGA